MCVSAVDVDQNALEETAARERWGENVLTYVADVSNEEAVKRLINAASAHWGRLDGIFNNAAIVGPIQAICDYRSEEFDRVLQTNVRGVWLGMKYAIPALRSNGGGVILNTASIAGLRGWPRQSGYVASKHAVVGLTRAVAIECATERIRANALCPGSTDTRMLASIGDSVAPGDPARARHLQEQHIPTRRLARPAEIAELAAWVLVEAPEFLTGAVITVDGGQTAGFGP
jgi:NAD(P)-dependent dehydrogenase (short-subunit alcohol dehydrogenase family)